VTMAQYRDFVETLSESDAELRLPRDQVDGLPFMRLEEGRWTIPSADRHGDSIHPTTPVLSLQAQDAEAYCAWRSERDERRFRLPTRDEWEYVARGGDSRFFSWGDRYEPTYCWCADRQRGRRHPAVVGRVAEDVSVVGARDLVGGVGDWLADDFAEDDSLRHVGGGSWFAGMRYTRLARRFGFAPRERNAGLGFRLLLELRPTT